MNSQLNTAGTRALIFKKLLLWIPGVINAIKRFIGGLLILIVGSFIVFATLSIAPGDPALTALGESASPDALDAFRKRYHLDQSMMLQYWHWLTNFLQGDFGASFAVARGE